MNDRAPPSLNLDSIKNDEEYGDSEDEGSEVAYDPVKEVAEEYERKVAALEAEKESLIAARDDALEKAKRDQEALRRRDADLDILHAEFQIFETKETDLRKEIKNMTKMHEIEIKRLQDDLMEMAEYREKFASVSKQLDRYRAKIDEMGGQQTRIETLERELNDRLTEAVDLEKCQREVSSLTQQLEEYKNLTAKQEAELITLTTEKELTEKECSDLKHKIQQLERDMNALNLQVSLYQDPGARKGEDKSVNMIGGDSILSLKAQVLKLEKQLEVYKQSEGQNMAQNVSELQQKLDVAERTRAALQLKLQEVLSKNISANLAQSTVPEGESGNMDRYKAVMDQEKVKQAKLHEVYSRVVQRLCLTLMERKIQCKHHCQELETLKKEPTAL